MVEYERGFEKASNVGKKGQQQPLNFDYFILRHRIKKYCAAQSVPPHNEHTLFAPTKMCLFGEEEDFGKINSLYFFQH